ncbi:MAG: Trp biosynthesis-associated membrane protein [Propionibacteriaceae bacterium]|nr:Trp biosynthesis-associated membrane protein [Propionibacteriaceae bacterium]
MRSRALAFCCLLLGGLLAVVSSDQPWWRASGGGLQVAFTGTESTAGLSRALAVVALAGTLLVLALRVRGRHVMAVLLAASGLGLVAVGALALRPSPDVVRTKMRQVSLVDSYALAPTSWPPIFALAGVLVLVGAAVLLLRASRWPGRSGRFERAAPQRVESLSDDPAGVWKALDDGLDPTAGSETQDIRAQIHPDVRNEAPGDTMGAKK